MNDPAMENNSQSRPVVCGIVRNQLDHRFSFKDEGGTKMKMNFYTLLILAFISLSITPTYIIAEEIKFSKAQICKACIATVMEKDPRTIKIEKAKDQIIYLSYIRPSDKKKWSYRCKLSGNRAIWASDTGRWRDSKYDSKIIYKIKGETLQLEDRFSDGSGNKKSFSFEQLN